MTKLPTRLLAGLARDYHRAYGLRPAAFTTEGVRIHAAKPDSTDTIPAFREARRHAIHESLRWGEPFVFFLGPGMISWMIPAVKGQELVAGISGGVVIAEDQAEDREEAIATLRTGGLDIRRARAWVRRLPVWPLPRVQEAADRLQSMFYERSGWQPHAVQHRREQAAQQRQIAEEIHRRKSTRDHAYPFEEERILLSLIRAGDRKGARRVLNRMLGAMFLRSANPAVVRALMIEMMGYLVRTAVEDSPHLEPLLEKNHQWMAAIIRAGDFEELSGVLRESLDDFMENIYRRGYQPGHNGVRKAMDYITEHYRDDIRVRDVAAAAGRSESRISHLMKEYTGHSILHHIHQARIKEAKKLLEETNRSCTDIGYDVGFSDQSYFTKIFRQQTGLPPARFRRTTRGAG